MNEYFENYTKGMAKAIVSDPIVTSLFVGSFAVGARKGLLAGAATFFLGYAGMGEVTNHAISIVQASRGLQSALIARHRVPQTTPVARPNT